MAKSPPPSNFLERKSELRLVPYLCPATVVDKRMCVQAKTLKLVAQHHWFGSGAR